MTDWLEWRRGGIGASDIASATMRMYGGGYKVVASKLGRIDEPATAAMERGNRWEQRIADVVHAATGLWVVGEQTWCQHPDHPRHRATVDGFLAPTPEATIADVVGVVEVKTVGRGRSAPWLYYSAQVQWQMWVSGLQRALLAVAEIDDVDDELIRVDLRWIDRAEDYVLQDLVNLAEQLLAHVDAGTLPEPDAENLNIVRAVNRRADPDAESVDMDDMAGMVEQREAIRERVRVLEEEGDAIEARILHRLGAATVGRAGTWRVRLSQPANVLTSAGEQRLLAERPDLGRLVVDRERAKKDGAYGRFTEPVGARRLTITDTSKGKS
jgi:putative phage-type endonuclease